MTSMDLLYLESLEEYNETMKYLGELFPNAKIEDASDYIHEYRIQIIFNDGDEPEEKEYYKKLHERKILLSSFNFGLFRMTKPDEFIKFATDDLGIKLKNKEDETGKK